MNINQAIKQRHSCRAFTKQAVSKTQIDNILTVARQAPSGANTQPWQVAVITGQTKHTLQTAIEQAFENGIKPNPDYLY